MIRRVFLYCKHGAEHGFFAVSTDDFNKAGGGGVRSPAPFANKMMRTVFLYCKHGDEHGLFTARKDGFPRVAALLRMCCWLHLHNSLNKKRAASTPQARQAKVGRETYPVLGWHGARTPVYHSTFPLVAASLRPCWLLVSQMVF